ncbi:hypothetical protein [Mycolicibacterium houstonense]|uniref:hypothetical protein n=1 Tax=Mycolicibacterium houstonense TaxID=146021 RepID=UPI0008334BA8|nr:hypothetical protein [Mycolicibacterium houstonense]
MSLLEDRANYEPCTVFPEETARDEDGNLITRPAAVGISTIPGYGPVVGRFQPASMSGTSARRAEQDNEGFESEQMYKLRFPRKLDELLGELGAQSEIEWRGKRWTIFGDPYRFNGSRRTAHIDYLLRRY